MQTVSREVVENVVRVTPPVTVSAASVAGIPLETWVYIATLAYIGLQAGFLVYRWWFEHKRNSRED